MFGYKKDAQVEDHIVQDCLGGWGMKSIRGLRSPPPPLDLT